MPSEFNFQKGEGRERGGKVKLLLRHSTREGDDDKYYVTKQVSRAGEGRGEGEKFGKGDESPPPPESSCILVTYFF